MTNSTFSTLNSPGDFVNLTSVGMLVLKISNTEFRAFDNCCPHNGAKVTGHIQMSSLNVVDTETVSLLMEMKLKIVTLVQLQVD